MFSKLRNWLALADYEEAKDAANNEIIARFSRRNVSVQNGWHLIDSNSLDRLSREGDVALGNILNLISKNTAHEHHG